MDHAADQGREETMGRFKRRKNILGAGIGAAFILLLTTPDSGHSAGSFTATRNGTQTNYSQISDKIYNRVNKYNIDSTENHVYQRTGSSIFVQRVMSNQSSGILGQLIPNGQVWVMNPSGALISNPTASIVQTGNGFIAAKDGKTTMYFQSAEKVYNRTPSYNILADEKNIYYQQGPDAIFVQRVTGGQPSNILGELIANGKVWIMNASGVLIGAGATVNTAGFMATSLVMDEADFFAGRYVLRSTGRDGFVVNRGTIEAKDGGYAVLAGGSVVSEGTVEANLGEVVLAAGRAMTVDFAGDGLINFAVDKQITARIKGPDRKLATTAVLNTGLLHADGGRVTITARAAARIVNSVVNNTGLIEARSVVARKGEIVLNGGDEGEVMLGGIFDASAKTAGAQDGNITISGGKASYQDHLTIMGGDVTITEKQAQPSSQLINLGPISVSFLGGAAEDVSLALTVGSGGVSVGSIGMGGDNLTGFNSSVTGVSVSLSGDISLCGGISASGGGIGLSSH